MKNRVIIVPPDLAEVIALHKEMFRGFSMHANDDGDPGSNDDGDAGGDGAAGSFKDPDTGETFGFPEKTPIKDMTATQQAEYWRHKSQKHERRSKATSDYDAIKSERDELKQSTMTADEKAIEAAKQQADADARADERAKFGRQLVQAELRGALRAKQLDDQRIESLVAPLDHQHFLTDTGEVDTDKVSNYAAGIGGDPKWPDMGQGKRGRGAPAKGVDAGRDLFHNRTSKK